MKQPDFWTDTESAIKRAYGTTDNDLLEQSLHLGKGGSTVVTANQWSKTFCCKFRRFSSCHKQKRCG